MWGRRAEPVEAVAGGEIAHDAVRFPQHEPVLVHGRNEAVRVHGEAFGRAVAAERTAHVDTLERQPDLGARPEDPHDVAGGRPSPAVKHGRRSSPGFDPAQTTGRGYGSPSALDWKSISLHPSH